MQIIDLVKEQINASHAKAKGLATGIDESKWYKIPSGINSNIAWQIGHLIISKPFQLVIAPIERTKEIHEVIPFGPYLKLYGIGTQPSGQMDDSPTPKTLIAHFDAIHEYCLKRLDDIDENQLNEPTVVPHPIARTKYESLMWSFQHEIWHCGQISMIRRALGTPLNLG